MNFQISKTIELMKKCYDQPIIFHMLHCNLVRLLKPTNPQLEMTDEWSKILILSATDNLLPNQGIEIKIQQILKKLRPPFISEEHKIKTMTICYYLLSRPARLINHFFIYELVSNFLGFSDYIDGLVLKILSNIIMSRVYNIQQNKKLREDAIQGMLETISQKSLSEENKTRALLCFISGNICPPSINSLVFDSTYRSYKYLESICLYAKFSEDTSHIKNIFPTDSLFVSYLESYMKFEMIFDCSEAISTEKCLIPDRKIFEMLNHAYDRSTDKERFISDLTDMLVVFKSKLSQS